MNTAPSIGRWGKDGNDETITFPILPVQYLHDAFDKSTAQYRYCTCLIQYKRTGHTMVSTTVHTSAFNRWFKALPKKPRDLPGKWNYLLILCCFAKLLLAFFEPFLLVLYCKWSVLLTLYSNTDALLAPYRNTSFLLDVILEQDPWSFSELRVRFRSMFSWTILLLYCSRLRFLLVFCFRDAIPIAPV